MASATHALTDASAGTVNFILAGATTRGASYKDAARTLALPRTIDFVNQVGNPGSKGNDHIQMILKDVVQNSTTGLVSTGSLKIDMSIPRDSAWTELKMKDLLSFALGILGTSAYQEKLIDGIVP